MTTFKSPANQVAMTNGAISRAVQRVPQSEPCRSLDGLNFFLADVQTGVGPFLAIYLAAFKWNKEQVGLALTVGGIAGIISQTPAGALVDRVRSKRALIAAGVVALRHRRVAHRLFPEILAGDGGAGPDRRDVERF